MTELGKYGGRDRDRTCDPYDVNVAAKFGNGGTPQKMADRRGGTDADVAGTSEQRPPSFRQAPQLYLDCDGVLADFDGAFLARFGHGPRDYENKHGPKVFWRDIRVEARTFYRDLPLMADARELYEAVAHLTPIILTGCPLGGWAEPQKLEWAAKHFPGVRMITCMSRDKRTYCRPGDVLVDDYLKYRHLWEEAGGIFIHHKSAAESIAALETLPQGRLP